MMLFNDNNKNINLKLVSYYLLVNLSMVIFKGQKCNKSYRINFFENQNKFNDSKNNYDLN